MIREPDLPNAPMTRWIAFIQLFDFHLRHIPATKGVAQDGLSRRGRAAEDSDDSDAEDFLDKFLGASLQATHVSSPAAVFTVLMNRARKYAGHDRRPGPDYWDDHAFATVSMGDFASERASQIKLWDVKTSASPPEVRAWDANVVGSRPAWSRQADSLNPRTSVHWFDLSSPFHPALLRNEDDVSYVGREFLLRKEPREFSGECSLAGESFTTSWVEYRPAYMHRVRSALATTSYQRRLAAAAKLDGLHEAGDTRTITASPLTTSRPSTTETTYRVSDMYTRRRETTPTTTGTPFGDSTTSGPDRRR